MTIKHIAALILILTLLFAGCSGVSASSTVENAIDNALDYIAEHQEADGGFSEPGISGSQTSTTWFAINAIAAAGEDPLNWRVNGVSTLDFWTEEQSGSDGTGELGKICTLLAIYGIDPHIYNGHNYVQELKAKMKSDGRIGDYVYTTYWGIFGLVAADEDVSKSIAWLKTQQHDDGGFGSYGGEYSDLSDPDNTAAAIMALRAAGVSADDSVIQKAVQYLKDTIQDSGGYTYGYYSSPNLASTAWVVQAFCSVGIDPSTVKSAAGNSPVDYLLSLQKSDGSFKYTETLTDSPVSMTARAVAALAGASYPITKDSQKMEIVGGSVIETATPSPPTTTQTPSSSNWKSVTITDDYGDTVTINNEPQRIISLAPANTEILFAIGAGDRVIAVTEYCTYPEEATKRTIIGGYSTVNVERVVSMNPDLILAYAGNGEDTINHLRTLGFTVITLNADSIEGTLHDIEIVGKAVGGEEEAAALIADMNQRLDAVSGKTNTLSESEKPTVVHCMWTDPLWVSGSNTFQNEMIEFAGGKNAASETEGWGVITLEKFLTIDPDIIIVDTGMGMGEGAEEALKNTFYNDPRFSQLKAVKNNQIYAVNADIIDRGGPRIADGIDAIASILHPDIFGEYVPDYSGASSPGFGVLPLLSGLAVAVVLLRRI